MKILIDVFFSYFHMKGRTKSLLGFVVPFFPSAKSVLKCLTSIFRPAVISCREPLNINNIEIMLGNVEHFKNIVQTLVTNSGENTNDILKSLGTRESIVVSLVSML